MQLADLGFPESLAKALGPEDLAGLEIGRVVAEHKEQYLVLGEHGEVKAEVTGKLRFASQGREDFPAVGDWVLVSVHDGDFALIHRILPRLSSIARQAVGQFGEVQLIATNIDHALLVQAIDRDFNVNRLERYLTICNASRVSPIIVLTKIDLIDEPDLAEIVAEIRRRISDIPVVAISNQTRRGYADLDSLIQKGKTYCLLGSSGVGKSSLLNNLCGRNIMKTNAISVSTSKGRHVTTHRELIVLDNGAMLVDNPGMREVGIVDDADGLRTTFDKIFSQAKLCRFQDCSHVNEAGCAVLAAVEKGEIDSASYESYLKMEREKAHFESTQIERRKKDKAFGKMLKGYKKDLKQRQR